MVNKLIDYFSSIMPLTEAERQSITDNAGESIKFFKKGTVLLREGQIATESYFVLTGCVRKYVINDGEERTTHFFTEQQFVVSLDSLNQNTPATHFFDCCEDATLVVAAAKKEEGMYQQFPKFLVIARIVMERMLAEQQEWMESYITTTPEQRYLKLMTSRPELLQRVPQYQIASYIGVKPESLSRIRKRMHTKMDKL